MPFFLVDEDDGAETLNAGLEIPENQELFSEGASVEVREFRDGYYQPVVKRDGTGHTQTQPREQSKVQQRKVEVNQCAAPKANFESSAQIQTKYVAPTTTDVLTNLPTAQKPKRRMKKLMTPADMMREATTKSDGESQSVPDPSVATANQSASRSSAVSSHSQCLNNRQAETQYPTPKSAAPPQSSAILSQCLNNRQAEIQYPTPKPAAPKIHDEAMLRSTTNGHYHIPTQHWAAEAMDPTVNALFAAAAEHCASVPSHSQPPATVEPTRTGVMQGGQSVDVMQLFAAARSHQSAEVESSPPCANPMSLPAPVPLPAPAIGGKKKGKNKPAAPQRTPEPPKPKQAPPPDKKSTTATHFAMPASMTAPDAAALPLPSFASFK